MHKVQPTDTGYIIAFENSKGNIQEIEFSAAELMLIIQDAFDCKADFRNFELRFYDDCGHGMNFRTDLRSFLEDMSDEQFEMIIDEFTKQQRKIKL